MNPKDHDKYLESSQETIFSCGEMGEGKESAYFGEHQYDEGAVL